LLQVSNGPAGNSKLVSSVAFRSLTKAFADAKAQLSAQFPCWACDLGRATNLGYRPRPFLFVRG